MPGARQEHFLHNPKDSHALMDEVLAFMLEHETVTEWWAHNMGKFDGLFTTAAATRAGWVMEGTLADSRVIHLGYKRNKKSKVRLSLLDTFNLVPSSLRTIGEDFALASTKLFTENNYKGDMRDLPVIKLKTGCLADCHLVIEALEKLETLVQGYGGTLRRTFASTAMGIVRANLQARGTDIPDFRKVLNAKKETWVNELAELAMNGGRVEVLHHNLGIPVEEVDRNSSYPAAMSEPHAWEFKLRAGEKLTQKLWDKGEDTLLIRAKVTVPDMWLPPLPHKTEDGVFFPTGTWEGWFVAEELSYAQTFGTKVKPLESLVYTTENHFNKFIQDVYQTKATGQGTVRRFAKDLLNGCYGKFQESPEHEVLNLHANEEDGLDYARRRLGRCKPAWNNGDFRATATPKFSWARHAHYAIAAGITAKARIALHKALMLALYACYCDTDSCHCAKWNGETNSLLGGWKQVSKGHLAEFLAPKMYRLTSPDPCKDKDCAVVDNDEWQGSHTPDGRHIDYASKGFPVTGRDFEMMLGSGQDLQDFKAKHKREPTAKERAKQRKVRVVRTRLLRSQINDMSSQVLRQEQFKQWRGMSMKRRPLKYGSTVPWTVSELQREEHRNAVCPLLVTVVEGN